MALVIDEKTPCPICGEPIRNAAEATGFPAFLHARHRLAKFSDAVFHKNCFAGCPERAEVEALFSRYRQIWDSRPKNLTSAAEINAWGQTAFREFSDEPKP